MRKSLDELEIQNGKVVTKTDKKEFNGTIVSKYKTGEVRTETEVKNGRQLNTTSYDITGKVTSTTKSPLASKERSFGYEDVSNSYNHYNQKRQENLGSSLLILGSIVMAVILMVLSAKLFSKDN